MVLPVIIYEDYRFNFNIALVQYRSKLIQCRNCSQIFLEQTVLFDRVMSKSTEC